MLSDERILRLLNDAHRAQAWHDGEAPKVHLVERDSRDDLGLGRRWVWRVGVGLSLAACAAIAVTLSLSSGSSPAKTGNANPPGVVDVVRLSPPAPPTEVSGSESATIASEPESVLMAIVQDDVGDVRCVRWSCADFDGRSLNELKENELRTAGLAMLCQERPSRLVVVAMQGPKQAMPTSDSHATHLARCIMAAPACDSGSISMRDCNGGSCVGSDVQVRVEAVAMR
jgi:hypothetical protein